VLRGLVVIGAIAAAAAAGGTMLLWPSTPAVSRVASSTCEQRPERVVIVGASFTAGVGPGKPDDSWADLLTRQLHADAIVAGVPGAGYVRTGQGRRGPVMAELERIDLPALAPELVIVQAGHDDIGVPANIERWRVTQAIELVRAEAPKARIALVTVFTRKHPTQAAYRTDSAIVTAARAADPSVIIMDPLTSHWIFGRVRDGLHPNVAGSEWLAATVGRALRANDAIFKPLLSCQPVTRQGPARST